LIGKKYCFGIFQTGFASQSQDMNPTQQQFEIKKHFTSMLYYTGYRLYPQGRQPLSSKLVSGLFILAVLIFFYLGSAVNLLSLASHKTAKRFYIALINPLPLKVFSTSARLF
jgi:hypothetical protein